MPDRSDRKDVQDILSNIRKEGINYVAAVSESFKTARSGHAFAKMAQELCVSLSGGRGDCPDTLIQKSIGEMQDIAQKAHSDATVTSKMFDDNRLEFTKVRRGHNDDSVIRRHL